MIKLCISRKTILILSMVLIYFLSGNTYTFAEDKDGLIFDDDYFGDSLLINQGNKYEFTENAFIEDQGYMTINGEYYVELSSSNQINQDQFETTSSKNSLNDQSQNVDLSAAHKYLGYATAILAGITAVSSSSEGFHQTAGYATAGLSLITTGIGFYEYGEYIDLDEGFSGYNMHMVLQTAATIGFLATAALQSDKSVHAAIGGVSTALMILPIFIVQW
jgi:hypothetical protein